MNKQIVYLLRAPAFLIFALGAATLPAQANEQQMMSGPQMMQSPAATDRAQMPYMPGPGMMNPGAGGGYGPGMTGGGCGMMAPMMGMMMRGGQGMGPGMMMGGGSGMGPGMMMGGGSGMGPGMMMGYRSPALELSPDQAKKIDAIRSDFFKAIYPLTREMFRERAKWRMLTGVVTPIPRNSKKPMRGLPPCKKRCSMPVLMPKNGWVTS